MECSSHLFLLYIKDNTLSCTFHLLLIGSLLKNYDYNFDLVLIWERKLKSFGMLHCVDW
jgi:hypothetical protein